MTIEETLAAILATLQSIDQSLKPKIVNADISTDAAISRSKMYPPKTVLLNNTAPKGPNSHIRSTRAIQSKASAPAVKEEQKVSPEATTQTTADIIAKYAPNLTGSQNSLLRK